MQAVGVRTGIVPQETQAEEPQPLSALVGGVLVVTRPVQEDAGAEDAGALGGGDGFVRFVPVVAGQVDGHGQGSCR